ncbi:peptidoglycan DD-metalloendopeptidase family protein [Bacillus sp. B-jedd]|uniref:peptidoglycan DD-metalloendopeptidase family protein n=1 Tax=Bacillus sp. B-jedd TaxID=1476857 RepID=UPI0005156C1A|nr:peptidoglycan DD-metalloendopeptidase family protein [Bacillus sp. B-jedd]CEG27693.1 M23/M37 family peptidase [Bacillus sp. B-jedd]
MKDYLFRFLIAGIMGVCISLLFLGGRQVNAEPLKPDAEWVWPAEGVISDTYGTRGGRHKGIDIAGHQGSIVRAANEGEIIKSYFSSTYGNVILISHPNGYVSVYAHLDKRLSKEGKLVMKGEQIGTMGNTGHSTGVHLHFELHSAEWTVDKKNAFNPSALLGSVGADGQIAFHDLRKNNITDKVMETGMELPDAAKVGLIHNVIKGDTLWEISKKYNVTVKDLKHRNSLSGSSIFPGQKLIIGQQGIETAHTGVISPDRLE